LNVEVVLEEQGLDAFQNEMHSFLFGDASDESIKRNLIFQIWTLKIFLLEYFFGFEVIAGSFTAQNA